MESTMPMARRVSPFLLAIIMITLVLSLTSIYYGIDAYTNDRPEGIYYLTMGITTLAISTYLLFQTRKRILRLDVQLPPLTTTLLCQKCGFRNVRDFQSGDYILKQLEEQCPKCNEKAMSIGSIFREVKDKEKEKL